MLMFLFKSNVYRPSGISLLKALLRRFILRVFILRELLFVDRAQSAKIRTRKIVMLHVVASCYRNRDKLRHVMGHWARKT